MKKKIVRDSKGRFIEGNIPWHKGKHIQFNTGRTHFKKGEHPSPATEFKKGQHPSQKTEFKKGHVPWIKGKKGLTGLSGEDHPNWQGGKSFEEHGPDFNNKFKRAIRKRDNHICMTCGKHQEKLSRTLGIHHINYDKKLTIFQNCISLCPRCHGLTNYNKKYWITFLQNLLSEKYGYKYVNQEIIIEVKNEC